MLEILGDVRHRCLACGRSCQGVEIPLVDEADRQSMKRAVEMLGIEAPIVDGQLRSKDGQCVFLTNEGMCAIHATLGPEAKPKVCRQWPIVARRVGDSVRVGIDPACYTHRKTWKDGPEIDSSTLRVSRVDLPESEAAIEEQLVDLLGTPGMSIATALAVLAGVRPQGPGLHPGLAGRLVGFLQSAGLRDLAEVPRIGPTLSRTFLDLDAAAMTWEQANPPSWPALTADDETWAIDAVRRMLWLRIAAEAPGVLPAAVFGLVGVVWCAWSAGRDEDRLGVLFASWVRALRTPAVWPTLVPEPSSMRVLLRGP